MTRGRIGIIVGDKSKGYKFIFSTEINGEMYPDDCGKGNEVVNALVSEKICDEISYKAYVIDFLQREYSDLLERIVSSSDRNIFFETALDVDEIDGKAKLLTNNYSSRSYGGSDYIYLKNLSDTDVWVKSAPRVHTYLLKGKFGGLYFGRPANELSESNILLDENFVTI